MAPPSNDASSSTYAALAGMIDHALLQPTLTDAELDAGCALARAYGVASVCIMPFALRRCADLLSGSGVRPSTTIGFPHGSHATATKVAEAERALAGGGQELDMVVNVSKVRSGDWRYVEADIAAVVDVTHAAGQKVKVIFENAYLDDDQKIRLCKLCCGLNVDWVKTSTGFAPSGATDADLILMRAHCPPHVGVKAAGGVRTAERLLEVKALGASRCGTSATATILDALRRQLGLPEVADHSARPSQSGY